MLRVATLNMQHGTPAKGSELSGSRPDAESLLALADELRGHQVDVLCLQEVDQCQRRSGGLNQAEILARELGMPFFRFASFFRGWVAGPRWRPRRSDAGGRMAFGVAVLSRLPVSSWHIAPMGQVLPRVQLTRTPGPAWSPRSHLRVVDVSRALLAAQLSTPEGGFTIATTHLPSDAPAAAEQLRDAVAALELLPGPHVLAGDLNLDPEPVDEITGMRPLARGLTFSNEWPRRQIDHLLGAGVVAGAGGVVSLPFSDHRLVWADVTRLA